MVATAVICIAGCAVPSAGQTLTRAARIDLDNDYFLFFRPPDRRPDDNYTQGARIIFDFASVPTHARRLCKSGRPCASRLEFGQQMYTPVDDSADPIPGERPYAGWLYVRGGISSATDGMRQTIDAVIGVTGPASLAEQTQEAFHKLIPGFRRPLGWKSQLPTEPDFGVGITREIFIAPSGALRDWMDLVPNLNATVGTLRVAVGAAGRVRMGFGLTHPWMAQQEREPVEAYVFAGGSAEVVGHDLFLDGSTFHRSARVERIPLVADWERGGGIRVRRLRIEYREVVEGREYKSESKPHPFGGISVTWVLR
jgi:lipid A 3-O-deacylase